MYSEVKVGEKFVANKTFSRKEINGCKNVSEVKNISSTNNSNLKKNLKAAYCFKICLHQTLTY